MNEIRPVLRRHVRILAFLLLLGLAVRLGMIWMNFGLLTCGLEVLQDDAFYNYPVARNIVQGLGLVYEKGEPIYAYHPPSVLFLIPFIGLFPDSHEIPVQCLLTFYTLISLATALFIYRTVRRVAGDDAALLSAGFWILAYGVVIYSLCGTDAPFTVFFIAFAVDHYVRKIRVVEVPTIKSYAFLGALCGVCIMSRMDSLLLLPAFGLHIAWCNRHGLFWRGMRKIAVAGVAMALAVAIVTAPFFLRHLIFYGSLQTHNAASNRVLSVVMGHYMRTFLGPESSSPVGLVKSMNKFPARRTPLQPTMTEMDDNIYPPFWGLYVLCAGKCLAVLPFKHGEIFWPLVLCLGLVLWKAVRQETGKRKQYIRQFDEESGIQKLHVTLLFGAMLFSLYAFYQFSFWHLSRYMYPLAFIAILYLGPVVTWTIDRIVFPFFSRRSHVSMVVYVLLLLCAVSFAFQVNGLRKNLCEGGNGFIQASKWINENTPEDAVVGFYQAGYFAYYIDREYHDLGGKATASSWDAWLGRKGWDFILEKNVDYVVDENFYLDFTFTWSKMYPLHDKLELVNDEFGRRDKTKILIFKVKKDS